MLCQLKIRNREYSHTEIPDLEFDVVILHCLNIKSNGCIQVKELIQQNIPIFKLMNIVSCTNSLGYHLLGRVTS